MMGMELDPDDIFEHDVTLELKSNGRFELLAEGEKGNGRWDTEDGKISLTSSDADISGTVSGDTIVLTNLEGTGMDITFEKK